MPPLVLYNVGIEIHVHAWKVAKHLSGQEVGYLSRYIPALIILLST